jgi:hypothetical protein
LYPLLRDFQPRQFDIVALYAPAIRAAAKGRFAPVPDESEFIPLPER